MVNNVPIQIMRVVVFGLKMTPGCVGSEILLGFYREN